MLRAITLLLFLTQATCLNAVYVQVYQSTVNGGITQTGNTLGLASDSSTNDPGTEGFIGAFITQDMSSKVNNYPFGTTLDWTENGSTAFLDLPPGSVVLHAELIWGALYFESDPIINKSLVDSTAVNLITPDSIVHSVLPKPDVGFSGGTGQEIEIGPERRLYTRTQDVTSIVASAVASFVASQPNDFYSETYIVGNVPGEIPPPFNNSTFAGWTLIVAFENNNMNTNQLTITTAFEENNSTPLELTGFTTPTTGTASGYVFLSAFEGDTQDNSSSQDSYFLGPGNVNPPTASLSGINNPANNFFGCQINTVLPYTTDMTTGKLVQTGSGQLDTRGSFGTLNHDPFTPQPVSGGRQGTDITSINITPQLVNGQTQLFTRSATGGENLAVSSISLQIQQNAPIIAATKASSDISVTAGDTVTFTTNFENVGQEAATDLVFFDVLPAGLTFNSGTFNLSINGGGAINIPINASDLTTGVDLSPFVSSLAVNDEITITFDITVGLASTTYDNTAQIDYASASLMLDFTAQTNVVTITSTIPPISASPDSYMTVVNTVLNIPAPGVLGNDTGTSLTASPVNNFPTTLGGQVSIFVDGSFTYTPPTNYSGTGVGADTFNYTAIDFLGQMSTSTVTITITPQAISDSGSVAGNTPLNSVVSVLSNDLGSTPFQIFSFTQPVVAGSTVTIDVNGNYLYTPVNGFSGVDSFTYTMIDNFSQQSIGTVTINVLPVAVDDVGTTPANTPLNGSSVFSNDPTVGMLIGFQNPSAEGGTVSMVATGPNAGEYTYIPPTGFSGIDTFTYTISDGVNPSVTSTVTITVTPVGQNDSAITSVNTPLNQLIPVLNNDIGTGLIVTSTGVITTIQNGAVTMNSDGTYSYQPPLNSSGDDSFVYTFEDQAGSEAMATVLIKILPVLNNDFECTYVNTQLVGTSVFANDPNPNELVIIDSPMVSDEGGTVMMNMDGTYTYFPPLDFVGTDGFSYTAQDPDGDQVIGFVSIEVKPPQPPGDFEGCIEKCEFLNKNIYHLIATWTAPISPGVPIVEYRIYRKGVLVETVPATSELIYEACSCSIDAFSGYEIASVVSSGFESSRVELEIVKEITL